MKHLKSKILDILFEEDWQETMLPWRLEKDGYAVLKLDDDSFDNEIFSIVPLRYDTSSFRGRIKTKEEFDFIFLRVKEDYTLTEEEISKLAGIA